MELLKKRTIKTFPSQNVQEISIATTQSNQTALQDQIQKQSLSLAQAQKRYFLLKTEEILITLTFITVAVLGRIALQPFPSVEPITFFTVLAGALFGWKKGATTGASAWYLSNFFMLGGQGPWTIIHVANGIVAGTLAGFFLHKKTTLTRTLFVTLLATLIFEISINLMSGILFYGIIISFITAIPFTLTHIISNLITATAIPSAKKEILQKGKLQQKELYEMYIKKIK